MMSEYKLKKKNPCYYQRQVDLSTYYQPYKKRLPVTAVACLNTYAFYYTYRNGEKYDFIF